VKRGEEHTFSCRATTAGENVTGSLFVSSTDSDDAHKTKKHGNHGLHIPFPSMEMIRAMQASWAFFSTDNHRRLNYTKGCLSLLSANVALQCTGKKEKNI
jgi:hypothetical protein